MKNFYYLKYFFLKIDFLFLVFVSNDAMAKRVAAEAQVIMKDSVPCFFAKAAPPYSTMSKAKDISVYEVPVPYRDVIKVWTASDDKGTLPIPTSAEQCVKYGEIWPSKENLATAKPLLYDLQYSAELELPVRDQIVLFRVDFCISKNRNNNKTFLINWDKNGNGCSKEPWHEPNYFFDWLIN